ncbi:MAG: TIGR03986 family CRISPR-associated RAMP protein [Candidatus Viridilinea halotolerans]|uniref:TIGR03986 family CRISPR-associated RAMP protein n=1 Tax=Candidatus Viridilinea halotolerans TaxID=2491704 RepID=A0A426U2E9_9CHLR|nr:MAG: TIGR03986 family CRISPR-associated RAMP protein [Candidatus Viridilinea halotolerans]
MSELYGEITFSNASTRSGSIKASDGKIYNFSHDEIVTTPLPPVLRDERVRFRLEAGVPRAIEIIVAPAQTRAASAAAAPQAPRSTPRPAHGPSSAAQGPYRFLNPYNFVRLFEKARLAHHALGDAEPPPHDRYIGLSGVIQCELTATTPLFISDSHDVDVTKGEKGHQTFQFFRDPEGQPAIPGTSLRGVIRSVFEAATNSCLVNFNGEERLIYRLTPDEARKLVPARVVEAKGEWKLAILEGSVSIEVFNPAEQEPPMQYAAWLRRYRPIRDNHTAAKQPSSDYARRTMMTDKQLAGLEHRSACEAIVRKVRHPDPKKNLEFWNVVQIAPPGKLPARPGRDERKISGYLCITNQNIENKHDERVFFTERSQPITIDLEESIMDRYRELVKDYQERHEDDVKKAGSHAERPHGKRAGFSRFVLNKEEATLRDGDLVYAMLERDGESYCVRYIVPVSVPRVTYDKRIGDLLPNEQKRCTNYESLCPACRTFGWVWEGEGEGEDEGKGKGEQRERNERTAYAGRVQIGHATLVHSAGTFDATLAILSTPKPTTTRFYLAPLRGKPKAGLDDKDYNYDTPGMRLRGRKFYRHHGQQLRAQEYQSPKGNKSDQNRTICGAQQSGSRFSFAVRFENLAPLELGALLWTLELDGWHHRIGYGKPLGFGSAQIAVRSLHILDPDQRYRDLLASGLRDALGQKDHWITLFKAELARIYGQPFAQLPPIRDLQALLNEPPLPVHYPRSAQHPVADGRNYEWFVGNKRNARQRLALRLSDEDSEGLPIIDRFGQTQ